MICLLGGGVGGAAVMGARLGMLPKAAPATGDLSALLRLVTGAGGPAADPGPTPRQLQLRSIVDGAGQGTGSLDVRETSEQVELVGPVKSQRELDAAVAALRTLANVERVDSSKVCLLGAEYVVRKGETLIDIARRLMGRAGGWEEIARANPGIDYNALRPGTVLHIPFDPPRCTGQRRHAEFPLPERSRAY